MTVLGSRYTVSTSKLLTKLPSIHVCLFSNSTGIWQAPSPAEPLRAADLHVVAKLARLSGLCYVPSATLATRLSAEGFQLMAQGKTSFTRYIKDLKVLNHTNSLLQALTPSWCRWYTAQGILRQAAALPPVAQSANIADKPHTHSSLVTSSLADNTLVILLRGVSWKSEETEMMKLGQNLLKFWPVSLDGEGAHPQGVLQAHGGRCISRHFAA